MGRIAATAGRSLPSPRVADQVSGSVSVKVVAGTSNENCDVLAWRSGPGSGAPSTGAPGTGGFAWPTSLAPQQTRMPLEAIPQAWSPPAAIWLSRTLGVGVRARCGRVAPAGRARPWTRPRRRIVSPTPTDTKWPAGGVAWPASLAPQQARLPSAAMAHVVAAPAAEGDERAGGWCRLAGVVGAPAGEAAVGRDGAAMGGADRDRRRRRPRAGSPGRRRWHPSRRACRRPRWRRRARRSQRPGAACAAGGVPCSGGAPAPGGALDAQRAACCRCRRSRSGRCPRRVVLAQIVGTPAGDGAVARRGATVAGAGGERPVPDGAGRLREELLVGLVAPALDGAVGGDAAGREVAGRRSPRISRRAASTHRTSRCPSRLARPVSDRPQEWLSPALTWSSRSVGASVWPLSLKPQHAAVPSTWRPHVWA